MRTFIFTQKNSSMVLILSADDYKEAREILTDTVKDDNGWRVDDEEGEEE